MFNIMNYDKINSQKIFKTVRGSIKKAIFYLGAKISYSYADDLVILNSKELENYLLGRGAKIKNLIDLDIKIRNCDDILDNELSKINPRPTKKY